MVIQLNSQVIWYEKSGEGDPVILLHGNQESHEIFDELAARLSERFTVYALDSRGHGKSATPAEIHYEDMATDVIHFVEALEIHKPILCGFSDGGIVALLAAIRRSRLFSRLIVCGANLSPKGLKGSVLRENPPQLEEKSHPLDD